MNITVIFRDNLISIIFSQQIQFIDFGSVKVGFTVK